VGGRLTRGEGAWPRPGLMPNRFRGPEVGRATSPSDNQAGPHRLRRHRPACRRGWGLSSTRRPDGLWSVGRAAAPSRPRSRSTDLGTPGQGRTQDAECTRSDPRLGGAQRAHPAASWRAGYPPDTSDRRAAPALNLDKGRGAGAADPGPAFREMAARAGPFLTWASSAAAAAAGPTPSRGTFRWRPDEAADPVTATHQGESNNDQSASLGGHLDPGQRPGPGPTVLRPRWLGFFGTGKLDADVRRRQHAAG